MSGQRTMKRSMQKAQGLSLRRGPAKASDGTPKGPARSPTQREVFAAKRAQRLAREAASQLEAQKSAAVETPVGEALDGGAEAA